MEITTSKIVAVVIAIGCAIGFVVNMGFTKQAAGVAFLIVPLGLIWFPEEIGSYTGYVGHGRTIDTETPPFIVAGIGWLFFILIGLSFVALSLGYQ